MQHIVDGVLFRIVHYQKADTRMVRIDIGLCLEGKTTDRYHDQKKKIPESIIIWEFFLSKFTALEIQIQGT